MAGSAFEIIAGDEFGAGETKKCATCGFEKPLDEFHRDAKGVMGRKPHCKACANPVNREAKRRAAGKIGSFSRDEIKREIALVIIEREGL